MPKNNAEDTFDGPFEVMVDTIGYPPNEHKHGDLLKRSDTPYDLDELELRGAVRRAPEYANSNIESTTQPVDADGHVVETFGTEAGTQFEATGRDEPKATKSKGA